MEITKERITQLNENGDICSKYDMVKAILFRASTNPELQDYFTEEVVNKVLGNITVCKDRETLKKRYLENIPKEDRKYITDFDIPLAFCTCEGNKIYVSNDVKVEILVHEIVHTISNLEEKGNGIKRIAEEYYKNSLDDEKRLEIDSLNEAITHFITQLLIPEVEISDGYNYGGKLFQKYYKICKDKSEGNKIFDAYFKGNPEAFRSIVKDFRSNWSKVMQSINMKRYMLYYREKSDEALSTEQIDQILAEVPNRVYKEKVPKSQAKKMAILWGEGSPSLTSLLEYCIMNNIRTTACCKGHVDKDMPYIVFQMPKEFTQHMLENREYIKGDLIKFELSRFGDKMPTLTLRAHHPCYAEDFFKKIQNHINEYIIHSKSEKREQKDTEFSNVKHYIDYIYSKNGIGKRIEFDSDGNKRSEYKEAEYTVGPDHKIKYAYSPIRRFCRASKKTLSSILGKGKEIMDKVFGDKNISNDKESEMEEK